MSTALLHPTLDHPAAADSKEVPHRGGGTVPLGRLVRVELRKMVDTRSGFWLLMSMALLAIANTASVVVLAPSEDLTYRSYVSSVGLPISVILPIMAILAVTSEWSQRTGLTTFTLIPQRGRAIGAKALATLTVGLVSVAVALALAAAGNLVGPAAAGLDPVWNLDPSEIAQLTLGNLLGMAIGFALALVLRGSSAAIVGYFVVSFVLSGVFELLAMAKDSFREAQTWVDWNLAQIALFEGTTDTAREWAMLGSTTALWIVLPLIVGWWTLRRAEVK